MKFQSAESAFKYSCIGTLKYSIIGATSCMLISDTSIKIIPRENELYGIEEVLSYKRVLSGNIDRLTFNIYNYKDDYYIVLSGFVDDEKHFNVKDVCDSQFFELSNNDNLENYVYYGAYIEEYDSQYKILVNTGEDTVNPDD